MTLTQTAIFTRRFIIGFIIFSLASITGYIGYRIWHANYQASLPPQEEKPDTNFGVLPLPDLPPTKVASEKFTYSIDTTTGGLPQLGKVIKVYFIPHASTTLLASEKVNSFANKFNINTAPEIISETKYRYKQDDITLTVELDTGNFIYESNSTPSGQSLDEDAKLVSDFKNFLSRIGVLNSDLQNDREKVTLLKFDGSQYVSATSRSEAQAARISIWPNDLDKLPIVTQDFNQSLIWAEVNSSSKNMETYRRLSFTYWPIELTTSATYPLKTPAEAFDELKSGKGTIIAEPAGNQVSITSVYLAYFESEKYTPYLQPVFVFEGSGFTAFVPAISNQLLQ